MAGSAAAASSPHIVERTTPVTFSPAVATSSSGLYPPLHHLSLPPLSSFTKNGLHGPHLVLQPSFRPPLTLLLGLYGRRMIGRVPPLVGSFGHGIHSVRLSTGFGSDPLWGVAPSLLLGLPTINLNLWITNIKNFVTTTLEKVNDFLSWKTQFSSFIFMHQLHDIVDGTILQPPLYVYVSSKMPQPNPAYTAWVRLN